MINNMFKMSVVSIRTNKSIISKRKRWKHATTQLGEEFTLKCWLWTYS